MKSYPSEWVGSHEIRFPLPRGRAATNPVTKYHVHVRHGPRTLARYAYYPGNELERLAALARARDYIARGCPCLVRSPSDGRCGPRLRAPWDEGDHEIIRQRENRFWMEFV